jgi:hypothetical protein
MIVLLPSVIFGSDNEKRIKELEEARFKIDSELSCLNKEIDVAESLNDEKKTIYSPFEYNYLVTKLVWSTTALFLSLFADIREMYLGRSFYVRASNVAIITLASFPIDYLMMNYLLKKAKVDKKSKNKKKSVEIIA